MTVKTAKCGTNGAYQRHVRNGESACPACKKAQAEYMRALRARNPRLRARERVAVAARSRALWRLAEAHPEEFQRLALDELRKVGAWRFELGGKT